VTDSSSLIGDSTFPEDSATGDNDLARSFPFEEDCAVVFETLDCVGLGLG
jgi:hypothetical protein